MRWFNVIMAAHLSVTDAVSHYQRIKSDRYFVWQEDGNGGLQADDVLAEGYMSGTTDLFTKIEFDPWADALGKAFDEAGVSWYLNGVQFEPDTGLIHHEWVWEVADGEDEV